MKSVLVTLDAVRPDHLGQYGYDRDTMPALDRLLTEGTLFEEAYANGPHSGVSIPSFLASQYRGRGALESGPNVATVLSAAGVHTSGFHSNTMVANELDGVAGFQTFEDFDVADEDAEHERFEQSTAERAIDAAKSVAKPIAWRLSAIRRLYDRLSPDGFHFQAYVDAERLTDRALSWLGDHGEEDFFLWLHYMDPHRPYGVDPDAQAFTDAHVTEGRVRELMPKAGKEPQSITDEERELLIDLYDSDLRYTSEHLDRLFDGIRRRCGFGETLVALTADHGEEFGEHGLYFHRNHPYDELLQVPLFVRHPERDTERVREQRELLDLAPTFCEFHGVESPDTFGGTPLYDDARRTVVTTGSLRTEGRAAGIRTEDWKLISVEEGEAELYDLNRDPGERENIAATESDTVESLAGNLPDDLFDDAGGLSPDDAGGATRKRLKSLGYLE